MIWTTGRWCSAVGLKTGCSMAAAGLLAVKAVNADLSDWFSTRPPLLVLSTGCRAAWLLPASCRPGVTWPWRAAPIAASSCRPRGREADRQDVPLECSAERSTGSRVGWARSWLLCGRLEEGWSWLDSGPGMLASTLLPGSDCCCLPPRLPLGMRYELA